MCVYIHILSWCVTSIRAITPLSIIILTLSQPILTMPSAWLGSDRYQFLSHWFDSIRVFSKTIKIKAYTGGKVVYTLVIYDFYGLIKC